MPTNRTAQSAFKVIPRSAGGEIPRSAGPDAVTTNRVAPLTVVPPVAQQPVQKPPQTLLEVTSQQTSSLDLGARLAWLSGLLGHELRKGGIYLLAGTAGGGKSTIGLDIVLQLGLQGTKSLLLLTEQEPDEAKLRADKMAGWMGEAERERAFGHIGTVSNVKAKAELLPFLQNRVIAKNGQFHGVELIVLDSAQGDGLSPGSREWFALYDFFRACRKAKITLMVICHATKSGGVAGPKHLQHGVDVVITLRKALGMVLLNVPKNRFGPDSSKPFPMEFDQYSRLVPSERSQTVASSCKGYLGSKCGFVDIQAAVSLPPEGRGKTVAQGIPSKEIAQITAVLGTLPGVEAGDLSFTVNCRLPGGRRYDELGSLALAIVLYAGYLRRPVPSGIIFMGEIDLMRNICNLSETDCSNAVQSLSSAPLSDETIFICPANVAELLAPSVNFQVWGVETLDQVIDYLWSSNGINSDPESV